jgi:Transposase
MPTSHAAVRHAVSWGAARRAERAFLEAWDRARPRRRPRHLGVDEIQRGKGQHFWTVLSNLVCGEVIGSQHDRSEDSLRTLLTERIDARQRAAVEAVCSASAVSKRRGRCVAPGGSRLRQVSCLPARQCRAR